MTQKPKLGRKITAILIVALLLAGVIFMNGLTNTNVRGNWWGIVGVFLFSCTLFLVPNDSTDVDRARWNNHNITDRGLMAWRRFQEERRKKTGGSALRSNGRNQLGRMRLSRVRKSADAWSGKRVNKDRAPFFFDQICHVNARYVERSSPAPSRETLIWRRHTQKRRRKQSKMHSNTEPIFE